MRQKLTPNSNVRSKFQLHYKGKPSVLKTIAGHAKVVVEEADKSHEDVALSGGARAYKFADSRRACRLAGEAIVKLTTAQ